MGGITGVTSAVITPALVNFRGMPSTETFAVGTKVDSTCATDSYCTQLPDPTLASNGIIVFYTYKAASGNTANTPTIFDCTTAGCTTTVDTFTHCGTDGNDATNDTYVGCYYTLTATTGSRNITCQWSAAVTQAACAPASFYNVNAVDVYASNSGTTTTALTSGSVTTTASNDLVFAFFVGTNCGSCTTVRSNIGNWTLGSQAGITWVGDLADRRDLAAVEHGVKTAAGAINPQITAGTSTAFVGLTMSFKSGTHGTAPTGMYIDHLYTVNSCVVGGPLTCTGTGSLLYQFPVAGNLAVAQNLAGQQLPTGMSDATNGTWKSCGPVNQIGGSPVQANTSTFFVPNVSPGLFNTTITTTGTGDIGPTIFYDIVGAATAQDCNRAAPQGYITATSTSFTAMAAYAPSASAGITLMTTAVALNTGIGCSAPSGCNFDLNTFGGESVSGPEPVDQNNMGGGHLNFVSNAAIATTWTMTNATPAITYEATDIASFAAPAATLTPSEVKQAAHSNNTTATTVAITSYTPFQANDLLAFIVCGQSSGTISVTDSYGSHLTYNVGTNKSTTVLNGVFCETFWATNPNSTVVTITATLPSSGFQTIMLEEFANCTTLDQSNLEAKATSANGALNGTTVTTLHANEALFGAALGTMDLTQTGYTVAVTTGNWTQENNDGSNNVSGYRIVSATGSYGTTFIDTTTLTGQGDVSAIMTFF